MRFFSYALLSAAVISVGLAGCAQENSPESRGAVNQNDPSSLNNQPDQNYPSNPSNQNGLTATDQSNDPRDLNLTTQIRQAVMSDKTLSINAQNVKIITNNQVVTLRGVVDSQDEKDSIADKAQNMPGVTRVDNQLQVKPQ